MIEKENPAHGGSRERERAEKAALAGASSFQPQNTTPSGPLASLLKSSGAHITAKELAQAIGVSDPRVITRQVERERQCSAPICASCGSDPGYFWPSTIGELDGYIRSLHNRRRAISATIDGLERARDEWTGQQRLDLDALEGGEIE